jgi:ABC-2 type transport system ATP-binding protein
MYTLELENVRKSYDRFVAVDHLSFAIRTGAMFGLLGPNGAGKTSAIRMMIGITLPDAGHVRMFGEPFRREMLKRVGYLPEERGLYPKMKVLEQLVFFGELHGLSASEARQRSQRWGERLEIAEHFHKKTLLHEPDFIIMDEPFAGLDPSNSKLLETVLLELREKGRTILFSSHRMDQVEKLCNAICLIHRGRAVLQGDVREVKARFGRDRVQIVFSDSTDGAVLNGHALVQSLERYESYMQVKLAKGADAHALMVDVVKQSRISRFEVMEPSLEDIFIEVVGKADA